MPRSRPGFDLSVLIPSELPEPTRAALRCERAGRDDQPPRRRPRRRLRRRRAGLHRCPHARTSSPPSVAARSRTSGRRSAASRSSSSVASCRAAMRRSTSSTTSAGSNPPSGCCGSALGGGALILALVALLAARWIARGVLAPVEAASRAAERIELGDFSARVPVTSERRVRRVGGAVQSDGRGPRGHDRAARGGAGAEPAVRRRRLARAPDAARGPRRRSVHPARRPRLAARRNPPRRASCSSATSPGSGRSSTT